MLLVQRRWVRLAWMPWMPWKRVPPSLEPKLVEVAAPRRVRVSALESWEGAVVA